MRRRGESVEGRGLGWNGGGRSRRWPLAVSVGG